MVMVVVTSSERGGGPCSTRSARDILVTLRAKEVGRVCMAIVSV